MSDLPALFFRDGRPFTGRAGVTLSGKPFTSEVRRCGRCGGVGGSENWRHTGWTCFDCNGSGRGPTVELPLYTAEQVAKLDAALAKRHATAQRKADASAAKLQAESDARRAAFEAAHGDVLGWLRSLDLREDGFLSDMRRVATERAQWTDAQAAAVYTARERAQARAEVAAASHHVGTLGERLRGLVVTVERLHSFTRPAFRGFGEDVVYIVTMRDAAGNCIVSKSQSFAAQVGERLTIDATVKDHGDFRGQAQTTIERVKVREVCEPVAA